VEYILNPSIKSILIVGGGSAGWLTAGILAARHGLTVDITLVESADIKNIGVGEGTWPTMKETLQDMGISETEFFRECDASFKQGAKFSQWVTGETDDYYYHPLMLPQDFVNTNLAPFWLKNNNGQSFSNSVCFQEALCQHNLAPKTITMPEFSGAANYAYHLDAGKFTSFLTKHCTQKLNVTHQLATISHITQHENGDIKSVTSSDGRELQADLFIDCTGSASLLLGKTLGVEFVDKSDVLFIDKAIAVQVPYESEADPILPYTLSTAQEAGWIWDIGLPNRRGVGHVYSSRHMSDEKAKAILAEYVGPKFKSLSVNNISIQCGHRKEFWKNNCVGIGMAAGFLEPLEASALMLIEISAKFVRDQLPEHKNIMPIVAKRFNERQTYHWNRIVDFLKLHYVLTKREDTAFWRDNKNPETIPDSLSELLALWEYHSPYLQDFHRKNEVFPAASYQYILYGMGFNTQISEREETKEDMQANMALTENNKLIEKGIALMPNNRELLEKINQHGMKAI
jgi:flavin-dependent dehydrogenase